MSSDLELLTIRQVCALLAISRSTAFRLINRGAIRSTHVSAALRVYADSVREYLEDQRRTHRPSGSRTMRACR